MCAAALVGVAAATCLAAFRAYYSNTWANKALPGVAYDAGIVGSCTEQSSSIVDLTSSCAKKDFLRAKTERLGW